MMVNLQQHLETLSQDQSALVSEFIIFLKGQTVGSPTLSRLQVARLLAEFAAQAAQPAQSAGSQAAPAPDAREPVFQALASTGLVTLPQSAHQPHQRVTPLQAAGTPASRLIIAERGPTYDDPLL